MKYFILIVFLCMSSYANNSGSFAFTSFKQKPNITKLDKERFISLSSWTKESRLENLPLLFSL